MTFYCFNCGKEITLDSQSAAIICPECGQFIIPPDPDDLPPEGEAGFPPVPPMPLGPPVPPNLSVKEPAPIADDEAQPLSPTLFVYPEKDGWEQIPKVEVTEDAQKMEERVQEYKKKNKTLKSVLIGLGVLVVFACVFVYCFITMIMPPVRYDAASKYAANGQYAEAYRQFKSLGGYMDSVQRSRELFVKMVGEMDVGDTIDFGAFDQDGNTKNGAERLQWQILAKEDGRCLLITRKVLDVAAYNAAHSYTTWATCSLRAWLNEKFLTEAFSETEQALILQSKVTPHVNSSYSTDPGSETTDRVFLLSITEVHRYFDDTDSARLGVATKRAAGRGIEVLKKTGGSPWWLRTPGIDSEYAALVRSDGSVSSNGAQVYSMVCGVRPAIWLDLGEN